MFWALCEARAVTAARDAIVREEGKVMTPPTARVSRREFVGGLIGLAASAFAARPSAGQDESAGTRSRIDVHHHIAPPRYIAAVGATWSLPSVLMNWTPARSLQDMDAAGVATSITSITTPGLWFGDDSAARRLARECNEYAARLVVDFPGRFGMFAAVPMPDVAGTLREITYALDTLHADGVALFTSYGDRWLGDAAFTPLMEELNRRKAVCYTHPTTPRCCHNLVLDVPDPIIEYGTDTTRTIASLVFSGTSVRFPEIRFVFSHAGGSAPFLAERLTRLPLANPLLASRVPKGVLHELQRFHYDVAQAAHPMALASLLRLAPISQVLFGTDFPFRTSADHVQGLAAYGFTSSDRRAIERDNARRLLSYPRG